MRKIPAFTLILPMILFAPLQVCAEEEGLRLSPVEHAATLKECSACHMVYAPQMLPIRSWQALMGDLPNHFGEDATLTPEIQKDITDYLVSQAADSAESDEGRMFLRRLNATDTPLRITEMPFWVRAHHELSQAVFTRPDIKSAANCQACHRTADTGEYFEAE